MTSPYDALAPASAEVQEDFDGVWEAIRHVGGLARRNWPRPAPVQPDPRQAGIARADVNSRAHRSNAPARSISVLSKSTRSNGTRPP
jgi:hypothetical protein